MFNYASFCRILSTYQVNWKIKQLQQYTDTSSQNLSNNLTKVTREIFKFLIAQTSLKEIDLISYPFDYNQEFTSIPGVMSCLKNLSELSCSSDICSCFFYQFS